jgi:hypothetical protein
MIAIAGSLTVILFGILLWDFLTTPKMTLTDEPNFYRLLGKSVVFLLCVAAFAWTLYRA